MSSFDRDKALDSILSGLKPMKAKDDPGHTGAVMMDGTLVEREQHLGPLSDVLGTELCRINFGFTEPLVVCEFDDVNVLMDYFESDSLEDFDQLCYAVVNGGVAFNQISRIVSTNGEFLGFSFAGRTAAIQLSEGGFLKFCTLSGGQGPVFRQEDGQILISDTAE